MLIQTIAQTLGADFRVVAQACEQVIRAHELLEFGEDRVGFDQVFLRFGNKVAAGQAFYSGNRLRCCRNDRRNGAGLRHGGGLSAGIWSCGGNGRAVQNSSSDRTPLSSHRVTNRGRYRNTLRNRRIADRGNKRSALSRHRVTNRGNDLTALGIDDHLSNGGSRAGLGTCRGLIDSADQATLRAIYNLTSLVDLSALHPSGVLSGRVTGRNRSDSRKTRCRACILDRQQRTAALIARRNAGHAVDAGDTCGIRGVAGQYKPANGCGTWCAGVEGRGVGAHACALPCDRSKLAGGVGDLTDRANLDGACLRVRDGLLALGNGDRRAAHRPALWQAYGLGNSGCGATLAAEAEQAVLAGREAEAWQA